MATKTLAQILRPIAASQFDVQRSHIYRTFKRMIANGMTREKALYHAQFSVDSIMGNYSKTTPEKLNQSTITLVRKQNGIVQVIAVCRPPKSPRGKATLELVSSKKKRKFGTVWQAHERLMRSIYRRYPDTYFDDERVFFQSV